MNLGDVCTCRKRVLIDAEAIRIGEVRAIVAKKLKDALLTGSSRDWLSSLQWSIGYKGAAMTEGCRVALDKKWR